MKTTQNCSTVRNSWIKEAINPFITMDGIIELNSMGTQTVLRHNNQELVFSKCPDDTVLTTEQILESFQGKAPYYVSSDVLQVNNTLYTLKTMEKHIIHRVIRDTIVHTLPFLEWISEQEDSVVIIQSFADPEANTLFLTAGLEADIQVELLNLTPDHRFKYKNVA